MAKRLFFILFFSLLHFCIFAQQRIKMQLEESGIYTIPCEVNGLNLRFIFDTGASDVNISLLDAAFMLKNGYISKEDFIGKKSYLLADGSISDNSLILLRELKIGNLILKDVRASVSSKISASLLLGQSAIQKMGKYTIDGEYLILYGNNQNSRGDYIGEYKNGLRDGRGVCQYPSGAIYDGEWKNNFEDGYGTYTWPTGDKYVGNFLKGFRSGRGTYTWKNGEKYVGQWLNGKRHGQGTDFYANGDKYVGNWVDSKRDGLGVLFYVDGRQYTGTWINDKMEGLGVYTWPNGEKYEGAFKNGYRDGYGKYTWSDGAYYEGLWKKGKRDGKGTYVSSNGEKKSGNWTDGILK